VKPAKSPSAAPANAARCLSLLPTWAPIVADPPARPNIVSAKPLGDADHEDGKVR